MLSAEEAYRQQAAAIRGLDQGKIRIGCAYGSYLPYLAELVTRFSSKHPGIHVEILEGTSSRMRDLVREGAMDFALISRREGDLDWLPLRRDRLLAVLPPQHPLHDAAAYPLSRFETDDFIEILQGTETDNSRFFARNGLKPKVRFSCSDPLSALSMVEAGLGIEGIDSNSTFLIKTRPNEKTIS